MKKILLTMCVAWSSISFVSAHEGDTTKIREVNLNEVVVQASRVDAKLKNLPNKVEVIKVQPVFTGLTSDAGQLIANQSSIDLLQYPNKRSAIGMRGFAPSISNKYNILLINGLPAGTDNISTIDLSLVEQVEIMKGPYSSLYGSRAMAGVINIVTRQTEGALRGNASVGLGSFMTSKAYVNLGGTIKDGLSFDLNVFGENQGVDYKIGNNNLLKMTETDKAIVGTDTYGKTFNYTKYTQAGSNLRLGYKWNDNWSINYRGGVYMAKDVISGGSVYGVYGADKKDLTRWNNNLEMKGVLGKHNISLQPYYNNDVADYYNSLSDSAFVSSSDIYKEYGFQLQDRIGFGNHYLTLGIDNNHQRYLSKKWSDQINEVAPSRPDYENSTLGMLAQFNFSFLQDRLTLSTGGRFDFINFNIEASDLIGNESASEKHNVFNPNFGVNFNLFPSLRFHGSVGTAFLAPDATQKAGRYSGYYTYIGNADLKPESSFTYDFGFGYNNRTNGIEADITYFQTIHTDMIVAIPTEDNPRARTYENANEAHMSGLELMLSYDLGALYNYDFSLKLFANSTLMLNCKVKLEGDNTEYDMRYVSDFKGNFGIQYLTQKVSASVNARYIGHRIENNWYTYYQDVRPDLPPLAEETQPEYWKDALLKHPRHLLLDANFYYDLTQSITLGASVANIFDENYTMKDGYNAPGRSFMGRIMINF